MTAKDHNKLLGIFFAIHAAINGIGLILGTLIYGVMGAAFAIGAQKPEEKFFGLIFIVIAVAVLIIGSIIFVPQALAAFKILKNKSGARFWATFGAITALLGFPLGTALGVYALWFLYGEQGKQFYDGNIGQQMPPPPNNWR